MSVDPFSEFSAQPGKFLFYSDGKICMLTSMREKESEDGKNDVYIYKINLIFSEYYI